MNLHQNPDNDSFKTLEGSSEAVLKVLGSKFLAFALPIASSEEALAIWRLQQKTFHDATHHCFAYRLNSESAGVRYNDDGEPAGTGGRPILAAIDHAGLLDVIVIVVRYFGGTKLGVGGLARAYGEAAKAAISQGKVKQCFRMEFVAITFSHHLTSPVMRTIADNGARVLESSYDHAAHLRVEIRSSLCHSFTDALVEATHGGVVIEGSPPSTGQ